MSTDQSTALISVDTPDAVELAAEIRIGFGKLKRRLRDEAEYAELTPSQASALAQLDRLGPCSVTDLALAEGLRTQSMGATVATLEANGFIVRVPDPNDGRRTILSLSQMAKDKFAANRAALEGWLFRAIQENLTAEEKRDLARGFAVLTKLVGSKPVS